MSLIDTHAHLYLEEFDNDIDEVVDRAKTIGVEKILLPNIDTSTIESLSKLAKRHPDLFVPMMGLHPTSVKSDWQKQLNAIRDELDKGGYIAVGEIGLDLHWDKSTLAIQKEAFEEQLRWSIEKKLPVSIHSRDAISEVIDSIQKVGAEKLFGVFHSFGGSSKELEGILKLKNFLVGINGVVTFKNSGLKEVLPACPLERLIVETDSPYLAPVPHRGRRNESSFLEEVVETLSEIYNVQKNLIGETTSRNARTLFNINAFNKDGA